MAHFTLYTSNRLEILVKQLARTLQKPLTSPFASEIIIVQSKAMSRWISMQLAQLQGICANIKFYFPTEFNYQIFRKVLKDLPEKSPFDPDIMTWKIMKILPSCLERPDFEGIKNYLAGAEGDLKGFQLAEKIADCFDQYLLYRPNMILNWDRGESDGWQSELWQELSKEDENQHRAALSKTFIQALDNLSPDNLLFPPRVSIFGISALPKFHLEILNAIARFSTLNFFLLNPCREYWGDIASEREISWKIKRAKKLKLPIEDLHFEQGNNLLASWGKIGRDFWEMIYGFDGEEYDCFVESENKNLLSYLQTDILDLRGRSLRTAEKITVESNDCSVQIHSCHSPRREIEVLSDQLLSILEQDSTLLPVEILVMAPDIEVYAPYIQAVFDTPAEEKKKIPFTIVERSHRHESQLIETFMAMLDLSGSRFTATQVIDILTLPPVHEKFNLVEPDLELIAEWVQSTGIRWGKDEESRRKLHLPAFPQNTWKAGLERLLLGYAMPGQGENIFTGILPFDHIEGEETAVLGKFLEFLDLLFSRVAALTKSRTLQEWAETLHGLLLSFFQENDNTSDDIQMLRDIFNDWRKIQELVGFEDKIDLRVMRNYLLHSLDRESFRVGSLTRGVTFSSMLPMRSLPFKVICLLGMNYDSFPRQTYHLDFDLINKFPQPGDRSRRHDDRYLFLETLLAAREKLYISYVGHDIADNSIIPPSVVVSELLDYLKQGFQTTNGKILEQFITHHRLQGFNPEYFKKDNRLFSYSKEYFQAAQRLLTERQEPLPFFTSELSPPEPEKEWKIVNLNELPRFFNHPTKYLLNRRLGIYLEDDPAGILEMEPFEINALEKYQFHMELVDRRLKGQEYDNIWPILKACGNCRMELSESAVWKICVKPSILS